MTTSGARTALAGALSLSLALSGCALVGYPSGTPSPDAAGRAPAPGMPAPSGAAGAGGTSPRAAAEGARAEGARAEGALAEGSITTANLPRRSDAGRTYEVFGVEYQVLHSAEGYVEQGMASWYGPQFHGRPTASGETFDQYALSAAHRTLPLHTWVEVTNLENGERLVVRVNDRGPFAHTDQRIIDLSFGAAQRLGVIARGTARVEVRALPEETGG
jgi:rare lipoprotein A